jgi:hypothetical protein
MPSMEEEFVMIHCPDCGTHSFMNKGLLDGPPHLNVNRCFSCFTEVRLVSLDPVRVERIESRYPVDGLTNSIC